MRAIRLVSEKANFLQTDFFPKTKCKSSYNWWQPLWVLMCLDAFEWASSKQVQNEGPKRK